MGQPYEYLRLIGCAKVTCKAALSIIVGSESSFDCPKLLYVRYFTLCILLGM